MGESIGARRRMLGGAPAIAFAGLLSACAPGPPPGPAPVILRGDAPGVLRQAAVAPPPFRTARPSPIRPLARPAAPPPSETRAIVVRPGQSVGGLARDYHVPKRAIIAANHLAPPYKIEIGQRLQIPGVIPGAGEERTIPQIAAARPAAASPHGHPPSEIIPLDGPAPARARAPAAAAQGERDGQRAAVPRVEPQVAASGRSLPHGGQQVAASGRSLPHGGQLPWPVHGRILARYGTAAGGGRNDGINIAAPRGAPVRAVDSGVVAYAGNELRGYGNLVLIKHPDGFISAYAHCEKLLVKRGERVRRGQVIARVGATGGVSEPQLHFELRRGEHAVDPRAFLAPPPRAASGAPARRG